MPKSHEDIVRGIVTSGDVGTAGAGLIGPEQEASFYVLAKTKHEWLGMAYDKPVAAFSGNINRLGFTGDVIEGASEAIDTGNFTEPAYSHVAYALTKIRVSMADSYEAQNQAADTNHEMTLVRELTDAYGRSLEKFAWLGDTASADKMLKVNDGWLKQITASGHATVGSAINGGDLAADHFYAAIKSLPIAWQQRRDELNWAMGITHHAVLEEYLSGRATGFGDDILSRGPNGRIKIAGIEAVPVPALTTDLVLCSAKNTAFVHNNRTFMLKKIDKGLEVEAADIVAWIGFAHVDFVLREVDGCAVVTTLNAS